VQQVVIDINEMIDFELLNQANDQISTMLKLKKRAYVKNLAQLKEVYRIDYRAPLKLENLNEEKFDMCISTTALEHFTLEDIKDYLNKLKKVLSKNAIVSSAIDYSDHYSHTDRRISKLNFLSFSEAKWRKYNNQFLFQNRLRHQDYKKIFEETGYNIIEVILGPTLQPPRLVSNEFDSSNNKTFVGWAYFLIKEKFD
jgi:cyclopropane fatty-acyl-phospholipid synthase-like methyltransferase